jgi:very-short-patch-repair endonuclease
MLFYDKELKALLQHLRKNMTDAENMVWLKLRRKQLKGHPFYCPKANFAIELDGG